MIPEEKERRIASIVGALVADAAAQPIHWNYNTQKLDNLLSDVKDVTFRETSVNPFYTLPTGRHTCYGDQSLVILRSLVECQGLDVKHMTKATFKWFGPGSDYDDDFNAVYKDKSEVTKKELPIKGPWRHFSIKDFIKNVTEGKKETGSETDAQIDSALRIIPVVALYAGRPDMLDKAEAVISQTQLCETSVAVGLAAARLLEYYIMHGPSTDALDLVINELSNPNRKNQTDLDKALAGFLREMDKQKDKSHVEVARATKIS